MFLACTLRQDIIAAKHCANVVSVGSAVQGMRKL